MMEAIVLAGGFGTRLRSVVKDVPKPMAPVAGKPLLEVLLGRLAEQGFTHVVLSLGYLSEVIIAHFGDEFRGMKITHVVEENPLGTGGAVRLALTHCQADHVYIFNGDTFLDLETPDIEPLWRQFGEPVIVARDVPDTSRYGRLEVNGDYVTRFAEKGMSGPGLINAGVYILPRHALDDFSVGTPFSLEQDYLCLLVPEKPLRLFVSHGYFIDIGIPEDYQRAQTELQQFIRA